MKVLIIGCGYGGVAAGRRLSAAGHEVIGMRRSGEGQGELAEAGIKLLQGDLTRDLERIEPAFDWVINMASSSRGGLEEYRKIYLEGNRQIVEWLKPNPPKCYVYTSSTSVYGQTDGSQVDEASETAAASPTSGVLIETEQFLRQEQERSGFPAVILRVAGIYGPGRGHLFQQFLRGEATLRGTGENYINMIHVEDLAAAVEAALKCGRTGGVYNVADDEPVTQRDFFEWLAQRLNRPLPPEGAPDPGRKRGLTNKRVSNRKLRGELGVRLRYPTFREGYEAEIGRLKE